MLVKLVMEFSSIEELQAYLAARSVAPGMFQPADKPADKPAKRTKAKKENVDATNPVAVTATNVAEKAAAPAQQEAPATPTSYEDIKKASMKLANGYGREALVKVLGSMGLSNGKDAKPKQYRELHEKLVKAWDEAEAAKKSPEVDLL